MAFRNPLEIDKVFVFNKSGIPLIMYDFREGKLIIDEMLLSGFLSAISGFSASMFQNESNHFVIDSGEYKISLFKNNDLVIAVIGQRNILYLSKHFDELINFFSKTYITNSPQLLDAKEYRLFEVKLVRVLAHYPIASDWKVKLVDIQFENHHLIDELKTNYPFITTLSATNEIKIQELTDFNFENREYYFEVLNFLYFNSIITFSDFVEPRDFIIGTSKLQSILRDNPEKFQLWQKEFAHVKLVQLFKRLNNYCRVADLIRDFGESVQFVVEELVYDGVISLLEEEQRELLIAVEIINYFLRLIQNNVKKEKEKNKIRNMIHEIVNNLPYPEIITRLDYLDNNCLCFNIQNLVPKIWDKDGIKQLEEQWQETGKILFSTLYPKYKKGLEEEFFDLFQNKLINILHSHEMGVLEPYLHIIEENA